MRNVTRPGAIALGTALLLAACGSPGTPASPGSAGGGGSAEAACDDDPFGCVEVAAGDPITIGATLTITGPNAGLGLDSQYGIELAAQFRSGTFMGHPLELAVEDDGCSGEGGTAAARALTSRADELVAVVGSTCSSASVPAAEVFSEEGILFVSPSSTAPSLTDPATHQPFFARTAQNDKTQGAAMAQFACEELGARTAATIHDGSPYAEQLQAVFVEEFASVCGGETLLREAITLGQVDFSAVLRSLAAEPPDVLYYPIFTAEGALLTQQARENEALDQTALTAAEGLQSPAYLEAAGTAAEGVYVSGPDLTFEGSFYERDFLPAYEELSGGAPSAVYHAHAYDATELILAAIEQVAIVEADTIYIPRTALRDAFLSTSGYAGITGTLSCDEYGDCADPAITIMQVRDGEFVRVWP